MRFSVTSRGGGYLQPLCKGGPRRRAAGGEDWGREGVRGPEGRKWIPVLSKSHRMPLVEMFVVTDVLSEDVCYSKNHIIAFDR